MPVSHNLDHVFIASLTKYRWSMVCSAAQNSHQGLLQGGVTLKRDPEIDFSLQELIRVCFENQHCGKDGKESALGRGRSQAVMEAKGQLQLTPMRNSASWMTLQSCPVLGWEGWDFVASESIIQGILATLGKRRGLRRSNSVQLRHSPRVLKIEGCPPEALPAVRVIILGSCSEIWAALVYLHHRELDSASFPSAILRMLPLVLRSLNAYEIATKLQIWRFHPRAYKTEEAKGLSSCTILSLIRKKFF